jgi:GT2 family glycosyltransferase
MSQLSIVIPTCNRPHLLAKCLERLAAEFQSFPREQYEVIVTDDGADHSAEKMIHSHFPWAAWVRGPRNGPAANRNNGARNARSDWLIFTDDDCIPDAHWLHAYSEAIANDPECSVFEGRTYAGSPRQTLADVSPINETGGYLWSCNFAVRRTLFESMRGFDERFPHAAMEDVDLWRRLTDCGQTIRFVSRASVCHPWRTLRGTRPLRQHEESTLLYLKLHPKERRRINSLFYLKRHARLLVLDTLPGIVQCRGRGLGQALLTHLFGLKTAVRLLKQ